MAAVTEFEHDGLSDEPSRRRRRNTEPRQPGMFGPGYRACTAGFVAAVLLTAFEAMATGTAMPVAVRTLHGLPLYSLAFSAYFTTSLLGMVVAGDRSDVHGPRLPLYLGMGCFGAGLLLAGTATSMWQFIAGRAVQGLGGGMVIVALYVVVARAYPERLRSGAFSMIASCWVLPSIIGPVIAGFVTDEFSWRWVFLSVAILAVVPAVVLFRPLLRLPAATETTPPPTRSRGWFALAVAAGAGLLEYAGDDLTVLGALLALAGLALLAPCLPRLLPRGTLRSGRGLPSVILIRGLLSGCYFGVESFIPLMLVNERRMSPTLAGLSLTGAAISWAVGSWMTGRPRWPLSRTHSVTVGAIVTTISLLGTIVSVMPSLPSSTAAVALFFAALGMGIGYPNISVLTLSYSSSADQGTNSAALQVSDGLGSTVMIGAGGAIFHALHTNAAHDRGVFMIMYATMIGVGLVAVAVSPRLRVRTTPRGFET